LCHRREEDNDYFLIGEKDFPESLPELNTTSEEQLIITKYIIQREGLQQGLTLHAYPDFGLYLYKQNNWFYLAVRCWPGRKPFHIGHMHNDQLSIELWINGKDVVSDPGSYLYMPSAMDRNRYRSVHAHFTPWPNQVEPAMFGPSLFTILKPVKAQVLYFGEKGFTGKLLHECGAVRRIMFLNRCVLVCDFANEPFNKTQEMFQIPYSPSYGNRLNRFEKH